MKSVRPRAGVQFRSSRLWARESSTFFEKSFVSVRFLNLGPNFFISCSKMILHLVLRVYELAPCSVTWFFPVPALDQAEDGAVLV